jgi:hypothetical protein
MTIADRLLGLGEAPRDRISNGPFRFVGVASFTFLLAIGFLISSAPLTASARAIAPVRATAAVPMSLVSEVASNGTNPGTCPTSNTKSFAKTKFVLHLGLAFGAFHRYLYKPFRAGTFGKGAHGRFFAFAKAGAAAVFIEHEVRLAAADVEASPTLCKAIAAPMRSVYSSVSGAVTRLRHGDSSAVQSAQTSLGSIESTAASQGAKINESANPSIG